MAAMTRDELIEILTDIVNTARARLSEARLADGLKAADMLAKLCGWNELEKPQHQHTHLTVDASLIAELRAGYAALGAREPPSLEGPLSC
jgi:hypothetical protein